MSDESLDNVIRVDFGAASSAAQPRGELREVHEPSEAEVTAEQSAEKTRIFGELIELGTVMVTMDARPDSVLVPDEFKDEFRLNLNFCFSFGIPDFEFDDRGVRASLSFGGVDVRCEVPWDAVYMLRSHVKNDVVLFPNDFPPEMVALLPRE